ncbi:hypothetical protein VST7929_00126 [Vibrio stylophorae]|uniref:Uncharacterized protein n=1 Tax=Vibrio stylophorae TaxID=659351 RepID=A0ABM8ZPT0_9VIBR|nr:hypothetical protein VST7929_00126 [Vibrio stylophorae]
MIPNHGEEVNTKVAMSILCVYAMNHKKRLQNKS